MKKFKFPLDALLKIRTLKEQECKTRIGKLQVEIAQIREEISMSEKGIDDIFASQDQLLKTGVSGQELKFFPYFAEGRENKKRILQQQLAEKEEVLVEYLQELAQRRADVKVISKMKEQKFEEYKKKLNKQQAQSLEEDVISWLEYNKG